MSGLITHYDQPTAETGGTLRFQDQINFFASQINGFQGHERFLRSVK
jgi:hypothetical protein